MDQLSHGSELQDTEGKNVVKNIEGLISNPHDDDQKHYDRQGTALCLSGGGFRAALFHLGGLRRLNELGLLSFIDEYSSVSGGSIIASWLAQCFDKHAFGPVAGRENTDIGGECFDDWDDRVAIPFRKFAARGLPIRSIILRRFTPLGWIQPGGDTQALAEHYSRLNQMSLRDLPEWPNFVFCASDLAFGVNWVFSKNIVGDYQAGHTCQATSWTVAQATAASSCFPVALAPMPTRIDPDLLVGGRAQSNPKRKELMDRLRLCDGGVYDNMGLEPVWKRRRNVLVSDGGSPFGFAGDSNFFQRLARYYVVQSNQSRTLRRRWLIARYLAREFHGAFWAVSSRSASYGSYMGYSPEFVENNVSNIRTDLDRFSEVEIAVLENHGYLLAEAAAQKHLAPIFKLRQAKVKVPHPDWMDEDRAREALKK